MNESGLNPVEYKVVVMPDPIEETTGGGIIVKTEANQHEEWLRQTRGTLVAVNDMAFAGWTGNVPKEGDKVYFAMFAGIVDHSKTYRVMDDKNILAVIEEKK
jgi:co-chaperonin GroES (HSP10)